MTILRREVYLLDLCENGHLRLQLRGVEEELHIILSQWKVDEGIIKFKGTLVPSTFGVGTVEGLYTAVSGLARIVVSQPPLEYTGEPPCPLGAPL